jgi:hypothetical protein
VPKFSIKRLLVSTTLIAAGLAMIVLTPETHPYNGNFETGWWSAGTAMIGAGTLIPFRRPILGAIIGLLFPSVTIFVVGVTELFLHGFDGIQ